MPTRPRQISSVLPKGDGREDLAKAPCPTHRKTGKPNQGIAIRRQELRGGRGAAGRHPQCASPPSPDGRVRARPEKCSPGRARRSRRRRTGGGGRRSTTAPATRRTGRCTVRYVQNRVSSVVHLAPFAARQRFDEVNYPGINHNSLRRVPSVANRASEESRTVSRTHVRDYGCVQR